MSDTENTINNEELPMEQPKKAVKIQDLVFVRQYIDKKMADEVPVEVENKMGDYYKKTDIVGSAMYAEDAGKVNGIDVTVDSDGIVRFGGVVVPQKKPVAENINAVNKGAGNIMVQLPGIILDTTKTYSIEGTWAVPETSGSQLPTVSKFKFTVFGGNSSDFSNAWSSGVIPYYAVNCTPCYVRICNYHNTTPEYRYDYHQIRVSYVSAYDVDGTPITQITFDDVDDVSDDSLYTDPEYNTVTITNIYEIIE